MRHCVCGLVLLAFAAASCQPDQPRRPPGTREDLVGGGGSEASGSADARPVRYRVFNREDVAGPPRATIHLLVDAGANRDELRVTLAKALEDVADGDSSLVALRAVGYVGRPAERGSREVDLVPIAWAEWLPPSGWHDAVEGDRAALHRLYFYLGAQPPWQ